MEGWGETAQEGTTQATGLTIPFKQANSLFFTNNQITHANRTQPCVLHYT